MELLAPLNLPNEGRTKADIQFAAPCCEAGTPWGNETFAVRLTLTRSRTPTVGYEQCRDRQKPQKPGHAAVNTHEDVAPVM